MYRTRDSRLHRDVAIEVLPAAFAADPIILLNEPPFFSLRSDTRFQ